jgi:hypothetical protein
MIKFGNQPALSNRVRAVGGHAREDAGFKHIEVRRQL